MKYQILGPEDTLKAGDEYTREYTRPASRHWRSQRGHSGRKVKSFSSDVFTFRRLVKILVKIPNTYVSPFTGQVT